MQDGGFLSWDEWKPILNGFNCPCCMGVRFVPDEQELEQRINEQLDRERIKDAILSLEIQQMNKAIEKAKAVGNFDE